MCKHKWLCVCMCFSCSFLGIFFLLGYLFLTYFIFFILFYYIHYLDASLLFKERAKGYGLRLEDKWWESQRNWEKGNHNILWKNLFSIKENKRGCRPDFFSSCLLPNAGNHSSSLFSLFFFSLSICSQLHLILFSHMNIIIPVLQKFKINDWYIIDGTRSHR